MPNAKVDQGQEDVKPPADSSGRPAASEGTRQPDEERSPIASVDRALLALLALADAGPAGVALTELASIMGVKKAGLHLTLAALRHRGFVTQSPDTGHYQLGGQIDRLNRAYLSNLDVRAPLRPAIQRLAANINEVCHIGVLDGTDILYVDKAESRRPIQAGTSIGMRLPALTTAMGRILIAQAYPDYASFAARFTGALIRRTDYAPRTLPEAWDHIVLARERGYGLDLQNNVIGLNGIAVAILDGDHPQAAVSVVSLADEDGPEGPTRHLDELRSVISQALRPPLRFAEPQRPRD